MVAKGLFANLIEQSEPLQFVLHRVFEFGETQPGPGLPERFVQFGQRVGRSDVNACHGLRGDNQPFDRGRSRRYSIERPVLEQFRVGEK